MIIIGSTAMRHHFPDFNREPKDVDIIGHNALIESDMVVREGKRIEILENTVLELRYTGCHSPWITKDDLLTLKASHLCWDVNWEKHMFDVQFLLKKGCSIDVKLFWQLYAYWNEYHAKNKRSDLKMSKSEFFNNAINYDEAEHDYLHTILNPVPTYTKVLKDNCEVELDENKFIALSHEDKLNFVREEVMIMAFERFKPLGHQIAYSRMLKKFILSHAPLFSLLFIIENYIELHKPNFNYFKKLEHGLQKTK